MEHLHQHFHDRMAKRAPVPDITTEGGVVMSVVYVTAEPTFTGVIGGYTTLTGDSTTSVDPAAATAAASSTAAAVQTSQAENSSPSTEASSSPSSAVSSANTAPQSATTAAPTTLLTSTAGLASVGSLSSATTDSSLSAATSGALTSDNSSNSSSNSNGGGMSTGAKAGLAIGIIAIVGLIAVGLLWFLGKKKREQQARAAAENEKSAYGAGGQGAGPMMMRSPTSATAPRLSLRPVSRMLPEFLGTGKSRLSSGNMLDTIGKPRSPESGGPSRNLSPSPQPADVGPPPAAEEQPNPNNPFNDPQNPFADPEKAISDKTSSVAATAGSVSPIVAPAVAAGVGVGVVTAAAATGAVAAAVSTAAPPQVSSQPESVTTPSAVPSPSPVSPAPVVAQGPGPEPSHSNVYRVLMDFKPSMDDELELRVGQLVRLLHEYDDGWALCIRLDRSQQGVVPRTCLAAKPSKPKPSHLNQYARGSGANSPQPMRPPPNGRMSPAVSRPMSPAGVPAARMNMTPPPSAGIPNYNSPRQSTSTASPRNMPPSRPMSPGAFNRAPRPLSPGPRPQPKRSMSPGPYGGDAGPKPMAGVSRRRSNSASALSVRDRRNSPPGPSKLGPGSSMARLQGPGIAL